MCENCFLTIEIKNRQHREMKRIKEREGTNTCSGCANHEETEDFSDCLCRCVLDGLEKGKNSSCMQWSDNK